MKRAITIGLSFTLVLVVVSGAVSGCSATAPVDRANVGEVLARGDCADLLVAKRASDYSRTAKDSEQRLRYDTWLRIDSKRAAKDCGFFGPFCFIAERDSNLVFDEVGDPLDGDGYYRTLSDRGAVESAPVFCSGPKEEP